MTLYFIIYISRYLYIYLIHHWPSILYLNVLYRLKSIWDIVFFFWLHVFKKKQQSFTTVLLLGILILGLLIRIKYGLGDNYSYKGCHEIYEKSIGLFTELICHIHVLVSSINWKFVDLTVVQQIIKDTLDKKDKPHMNTVSTQIHANLCVWQNCG